MLLDGRVAIVTGAGRGIGREEALLLGKKREPRLWSTTWVAASMVPARMTARPSRWLMKLKPRAGKPWRTLKSVTDFAGAKRIVECALDSFGKLNILVNNAGILRDRMIFNMSEDEWDAVLNVHLKGSFNCSRHACEYWREQHKQGTLLNGRVINTSSDAGLLGSPGQPNYGPAKAALATMAIIIDREMQKYGVTGNAIAPLARTRMTVDATPTNRRSDGGTGKKRASMTILIPVILRLWSPGWRVKMRQMSTVKSFVSAADVCG